MTERLMFKTISGLCLLSGMLFFCVRNDVRLFYVITGSMEPLIPIRSFVVSYRKGIDTVKLGQVIIFNDRDNKRTTAHRVVNMEKQTYITKGDANTYSDRYVVKSEDVLGRVAAVIPLESILSILTHVIFLVLVFTLGVLTRRFLLFLMKYDSSIFGFRFNRGTKKVFHSGKKNPDPD